MQDIDAIYKYIIHLRDHYGLMITLHPRRYEPLIGSSRLITFNIHENPYCLYLKTSRELWDHCIACQEKVMNRCENGSFCGTCHAGVREFIYPIQQGDTIVGFISVSGYRDPASDSYIRKVAREYGFDKENLKTAYHELNPDMPDKNEMDILMEPLCAMLELAYVHRRGEITEEQGFVQRVQHYLQIHHTRKVTIQELCEVFFCSRSYISHEFKKHTGIGINEYMNEMRIRDAKTMLRHTQLTIGDIAVAVGFSGSNYFTNVFTEAVGLSPREYRKNHR